MRFAVELGYGLVAAIVEAIALFWPRIGGRGRIALAAAAFVLGAIALAVAASTGGERHADVRAFFYDHHYVVDRAAAPAAALPLLVGAFAVVAGAIAFLRRRPAGRELSPLRPLVLAAAVSVMRFAVDRAAAPEAIANAFGVLWMLPPLAAWVATRVREAGGAAWPLAPLLLQSIAIRVPAIALTLIATAFDLGSHFSLVRVIRLTIPALGEVRFDGFSATKLLLAVAVPQLVMWPLIALFVALPVFACLERPRTAIS